MTMQLVGVGVGRTGTHALKLALERLIGGTCHHMMEVFAHPDEIPVWHAAMRGEYPDWHAFLRRYTAIVDFPGAAVWRELVDAFPDAPVLLSTRSTSEAWWTSADATIIESVRRRLDAAGTDGADPHLAMAAAMFERFTPDWRNHDGAVAAYEAHNAAVRAHVASERLVEYQPGDGWAPLCAALGVPVPHEPFPHTNTTDDFRARAGLDAGPS
jgi:hypothetical protein